MTQGLYFGCFLDGSGSGVILQHVKTSDKEHLKIMDCDGPLRCTLRRIRL